MKQAHILYSGIVQGVGFRYTTLGIARRIGLTGWVKNLPDGGVEILCNGEEKQIKELCRYLEGHFGPNIRNKTLSWQMADKSFSNFEITY